MASCIRDLNAFVPLGLREKGPLPPKWEWESGHYRRWEETSLHKVLPSQYPEETVPKVAKPL